MTITTENTRRFEGPVIEAKEERPGLGAHSDQYQATQPAENCLLRHFTDFLIGFQGWWLLPVQHWESGPRGA